MTGLACRVAVVTGVPVRRAGTPADIAGIIALLAGDDASFIACQTIYADGGRRL